MGIDRRRFKSEINDGYVCPLCKDVFDNPVMVTKCQENFCENCLDQWLDENSKCPGKCGKEIEEDNAIRNKTLENFMSHLLVSCEFASLGCQQIVALTSLPIHTDECCHNPRVTQTCFGGCGAELNKQQFSRHNCVDVLMEKINKLETKLEAINKKTENYENPNHFVKIFHKSFIMWKLSKWHYVENNCCFDNLKEEIEIDEDEWRLMEMILMRKDKDFAKRDDGTCDSELLQNYFKLLVLNVLSKVKNNFDSVKHCLINNSEEFLVDYFYTIFGIVGTIYTTQEGEEFDEDEVNLVEIDYRNKQIMRNERQISQNFDWIIESINLDDESVNWLVGRLNCKGKMLLLDPLVGRERNRFCLIEKLENGNVKKDNWEVFGTGAGAAGN